ncbi:hypothetical protein Pyn_14633 [Prunus yedoensis var. nudiflora]|uniref:TF-B3 domain-containing protein n=1 Tax=Prunus yedoensis var. nudiflora TaxID=2094558 RepID=A0A314Z8E7_PRUYE|nr:hypothetical protein Pyn_14633 [Prunus yedoensis var. nudiflora]
MGFEKCLTEIDIVSRLQTGSSFFGNFGRYRKPVLQSERWLKFVNYKGLKVGDNIVLDTEANDFRGTKFRIRAQKLNKECDQWLDV